MSSEELTAVVAVVALMFTVGAVLVSVVTRLVRLEEGSTYKDRRLEALESSMEEVKKSVGELLGIMRRIWGARNTDLLDKDR